MPLRSDGVHLLVKQSKGKAADYNCKVCALCDVA
jgi:hypothetical protein